jgi:serine/threonine-protein kinase
VARDEELHREVALKEIQQRHADKPESRARFLLEAEVTGGLEHPGIVPVYGLGCYGDGRPFYAMRFIRGDSLKEAIAHFHQPERRHRPEGERSLELRQLLGRFLDVCNAVEYAHSRGVLHRDLKPANILLGNYGETLVVDWGLAKVLEREEVATVEVPLRPSLSDDADLTRTGSVLGTPSYMSPEQAEGRQHLLGPRSDVYSLGATLYTLLTGRAPFPEGDLAEVLSKVQRGEYPPPRRVNAHVPPALEAICQKAMAHWPEDRYASARELGQEVERWLADEPVKAYPEPLVARCRRWMKRHRTLVLGAVTVLLVTAVALGVTTGVLSFKNEELRQAQEQEEKARKEAQANFEMASQAVEDYLFKVAEDDRLKQQDLFELRKKLLASAQEFYTRFVVARKEDPELELALGRAYSRLGLLHQELGETKPGREKLLQATALLQRLTTRYPDNPESQYLLGQTLNELYRSYMNDERRFTEGEKCLQQSLAIFAKLAREHPGVRKYRSEEQRTHRLFGWYWEARGHTDRAESYYRSALDAQRKLVKDFPVGEERHRLSVACRQLAELLRGSNRHLQAEALLREGITICEELLREQPRHPGRRDTLGDLQTALHECLRDMAKPKETEETGRAAVQIWRRLTADFPTVPDYLDSAVNSLIELSEFLTNKGNTGESLPLAQEAVSLVERLTTEFPPRPQYRYRVGQAYYQIARALHRKGDVKEGEKYRRRSIEVLDLLSRDHPDVPRYRTELAIGHSGLAFVLSQTKRLAEARRESLKALDLFEQLARGDPKNSEYPFRVGETCVNLSGVLVALGESPTAIQQKGIAALKPLVDHGHNEQAKTRLAALYFHLSTQLFERRDLPGALEAIDRALEYQPREAGLHFNRGRVLTEKKDLDGAAAAYREALKLHPTFAEAHCNLGLILQTQKQYAKALEHLRRGHELGSKQPGWNYPSAVWVSACEKLLEDQQP